MSAAFHGDILPVQLSYRLDLRAAFGHFAYRRELFNEGALIQATNGHGRQPLVAPRKHIVDRSNANGDDRRG